MQEVRCQPANSLIFVMDPDLGEIPDSVSEALVAATSTCVSIGTLSSADGETMVQLGEEPPAKSIAGSSSPGFGLALAWKGQLVAATRLAVVTVTGEVLASSPAHGHARVEVWVNDALEPDVIRVVVQS